MFSIVCWFACHRTQFGCWFIDACIKSHGSSSRAMPFDMMFVSSVMKLGRPQRKISAGRTLRHSAHFSSTAVHFPFSSSRDQFCDGSRPIYDMICLHTSRKYKSITLNGCQCAHDRERETALKCMHETRRMYAHSSRLSSYISVFRSLDWRWRSFELGWERLFILIVLLPLLSTWYFIRPTLCFQS